MAFQGLQEEELKNRIGDQFFLQFDHATIIGKIDFCVTQKQKAKQGSADTISLLWAEAKRGVVSDIYKPLVQLILTIGKARTFDTYLPPPFLAAFDAEKIAFLPYKEILPFFSLNDFNWNVAPSDDTSREFGLLYDAVKATIDRSAYIFRYDSHEKELREFIRVHLSANSELIQINKNNFVSIYQRWLAQVQPSIDVNWDTLKKRGIIDGDFFLADLLSDKNQTIKEALFVLLQDNRYALDRKIETDGLINEKFAFFKDQQKAHAQFWSIYRRPPKEEYWDYIINRRDLLVPQDVRERKGSFFTPKIWVDLSQKYLADVLGENWQDEYYVWDCAAGTGNLLNGLTNKYRIWASTLDQQDVDVMKDRIKNGANLLESHVFQFDFLNDEFDCGKLPADLFAIIRNPEERKKLVIYINPPYAEAGNKRTVIKMGDNKTNVAVLNTSYTNYFDSIGIAGRELFAQFMAKIYDELQGSILAQFSKLKMICAPNFERFRAYFKAKLTRCFIVPSATFDNVKGEFPIGFFIWDSKKVEKFTLTIADVYNAQGNYCGQKKLVCEENYSSINDWIIKTRHRQNEIPIGYMVAKAADFQNNNYNYIVNSKEQLPDPRGTLITDKNLTEIAIYYGVRHCIKTTWLNDRDLFHCPNEGWETDLEFQSNCLTFTLFSNNIQSRYGTNHWIPFTEEEVNAQARFESHFMTDFILGSLRQSLSRQQTSTSGLSRRHIFDKRLIPHGVSTAVQERLTPREVGFCVNVEATPTQDSSTTSLFSEEHKTSFIPTKPLVFSPEATAVFDAGRELWRYYHAQPNANPNASYYDIRAHFQGRNDKGKMNPKSEDKEYMRLLGNLKETMEVLRLKIVPKVYEYGFLIE